MNTKPSRSLQILMACALCLCSFCEEVQMWDPTGNAVWLRNLSAKCFGDLPPCVGHCNVGIAHISQDRLSCITAGNVVLGIYRHEHGVTTPIALKESQPTSMLWLDAPGQLSKDFAKDLFADEGLHAETLQANDRILIGTGAVAGFVGTATLQRKVD